SRVLTPPSHLHTLPLPDALPIYRRLDGARRAYGVTHGALDTAYRQAPGVVAEHLLDGGRFDPVAGQRSGGVGTDVLHLGGIQPRSEEHTSELQSRENVVCRLLLV